MKAFMNSNLFFRMRDAYVRSTLRSDLGSIFFRRGARLAYRSLQIMIFGWIFIQMKRAKQPLTRHDIALRLETVGFEWHNGAIGSLTAAYRWVALQLSAMLRAQEIEKQVDSVVVFDIDGPIDQRTLRNFIAWQLQPGLDGMSGPQRTPLDLCIRAQTEADLSRLPDLMALAHVSNYVDSASFGLDRLPANRLPAAFVGNEGRAALEMADATSLYGLLSAEGIEQLETQGCPQAFRTIIPNRKKFNDFVKLTAPGCLVIAVSLPETTDGDALEGEFARWLPVFERLRENRRIVFCLLNSLMPSDAALCPAYVQPMRHLGFAFMEAIVVGQMADAYLGVLDVFGLAALSAGRPGAYLSLDRTTQEPRQIGPHRWLAGAQTPPERVAEIVAPIIDNEFEGNISIARHFG